MEEHRFLSRTRVLLGLFFLFLLLFVVVLYQLQIVNGAEYAAKAEKKIARYETVDAVRGSILDRYGRVLVGNKLSYQVRLDTSLMGDDEEKNEILLALLDICREHGVTWTDTMPVEGKSPYSYSLISAGSSARNRFAKLMDTMGWEDPAAAEILAAVEAGTAALLEGSEPTARVLLDQMRASFQVSPDLPDDLARDLLGVRYELALRQKDIARVEYLFAQGVEIGFITAVKEAGLAGVLIEPTAVRQYNTQYAAHLLGRVGSINDTEWDHYKALGYAMDEKVGKDGVEAAFEEYLRGTDGIRAVETNSTGKVVSESWLVDEQGNELTPRPGDNIVLTIDDRLQEAVERALATHVPTLPEAEGAAAVVLDVNSAAVLASASYPTYALATYSQDFTALSEDPLTPFVNRAFQGLYAPGSTFKMVTAIAGLEEGIITTETKIVDNGRYTYYKDYQPQCWIYRQQGRVHGAQTVTQAITNSCNVFFYDVGRRLGIEKLGQYARLFGLGEPTGIELPEKTGVVAGPEYTESLGLRWEGGSTLAAAIGQENNQFTPLQLANYIATLANGGRHYSAHILKCVKSHDFGTILYEREPELIDAIHISPENLEAVKAGMLELTETGSAAKYFRDLDVKVGAKTGSAQVSANSASNAVFVAFAPFDDPQVALAIVVEKGGSGSELGAIAADILTYYFHAEETLEVPSTENTLIR